MASGVYDSAMPARIVRSDSGPSCTVSFSSFFDLGTASAASTFPTFSSTFMNSSMVMPPASAAGAATGGVGSAAAGSATVAAAVDGTELTGD